VHGAWYVNEEVIGYSGMLGRSQGCFAVADSSLPEIVTVLAAWPPDLCGQGPRLINPPHGASRCSVRAPRPAGIACLIHGPRAAVMTRVVRLGFVERIPLDPGRTAGGSVRNHAIEQCRGDPMPSERRGDDEARDSDHGSRLGSAGIDQPIQAVVGPE